MSQVWILRFVLKFEVFMLKATEPWFGVFFTVAYALRLQTAMRKARPMVNTPSVDEDVES